MKAFDCVHHNNLWEILKMIGVLDHLTYLLRNLHGGHDAAVRTLQGTTDLFEIGEGVYCLAVYLTYVQKCQAG